MKNMGGTGGSKKYCDLENPFGSGGFDFGSGTQDGKGFQNFWEEVQDFFSEGSGGKRGSGSEKKIKKGKDVTVIYDIIEDKFGNFLYGGYKRMSKNCFI
jgi:hypothetical protein